MATTILAVVLRNQCYDGEWNINPRGVMMLLALAEVFHQHTFKHLHDHTCICTCACMHACMPRMYACSDREREREIDRGSMRVFKALMD